MDAYTAEHEDALREITNVGMGRAGAALASVLREYVTLAVPGVEIIRADQVVDCILGMEQAETGGVEAAVVVRQGFSGGASGEALVVFGRGGANALADRLGHDAVDSEAIEQEILLDTTNLITGAVLRAMGEQLGMGFIPTAPSLYARGEGIASELAPHAISWEHALLVAVNFRVEQRDFRCHLALLFPEQAIGQIRRALDHLLEAL